jgi:hypothetical protein
MAGIETSLTIFRLKDERNQTAPEDTAHTVADIYETPTLEDMAEALKRFPRYELD